MDRGLKRNVLVTGGGGFLGSAVIRRLIERGDRVHSLSRAHHPELDRLGVIQFQGDISDFRAVNASVAGMHQVFHVAAKAGVWGDYSDFYRSNVVGTRNVIAACSRRDVSQLIYTSSPSVVFDGRDMQGTDESVPYPSRYQAAYPRTKAIAEQMVVQAGTEGGLNTIALRPHLIWGPGDPHLTPRIIARARRLARLGARNPAIDVTYIDNAAQAHVLAAEGLEKRPSLSGNVYFISQGSPIRLWEMINSILNAAGLAPVTRSLPLPLARLAGATLETVFGILRLRTEPPLTRFVIKQLSTAHWFSIEAAKRDLGYAPEISLQEGLARLKTWLETSPGSAPSAG